jgi:hypothetical protein
VVPCKEGYFEVTEIEYIYFEGSEGGREGVEGSTLVRDKIGACWCLEMKFVVQ